ncbi:MAG: hypothetical protein GWP05_08515 [Anaerolineaceae bacterium]|nr:hypothetical protein [Anaerolineaceae bacterium]
MLDAGAKIYERDGAGRTVLHGAANVEIVRLLFERGAVTKVLDRFKTPPLRVAEKAGTQGIIDLLKKHGGVN